MTHLVTRRLDSRLHVNSLILILFGRAHVQHRRRMLWFVWRHAHHLLFCSRPPRCHTIAICLACALSMLADFVHARLPPPIMPTMFYSGGNFSSHSNHRLTHMAPHEWVRFLACTNFYANVVFVYLMLAALFAYAHWRILPRNVTAFQSSLVKSSSSSFWLSSNPVLNLVRILCLRLSSIFPFVSTASSNHIYTHEKKSNKKRRLQKLLLSLLIPQHLFARYWLGKRRRFLIGLYNWPAAMPTSPSSMSSAGSGSGSDSNQRDTTGMGSGRLLSKALLVGCVGVRMGRQIARARCGEALLGGDKELRRNTRRTTVRGITQKKEGHQLVKSLTKHYEKTTSGKRKRKEEDTRWQKTCEISQLWIDEAYYRMGGATLLLKAVEREAMQRGYQRIVASSVVEWMPELTGLLRRNGYQPVDGLDSRAKNEEMVRNKQRVDMLLPMFHFDVCYFEKNL